MPPRRRAQYGTGTKPARRSDGLWVARFEAGWTADGKRRRVVVSAKTEAACKVKLKDRQREFAADQSTGLNVRETVKSWSETWLPRHARKVRPTTYATDAGAVRKWIVPTLGHRRLSDLTPGDLRKLEDAIRTAGRTSTTALHAHKTLLTMLKAAVVEGHHVPDRVMLAPKPTKAANDRTSIPLAEAWRLLDVIGKRDDAPRWVSALLQGMRQGESLGLTWGAVDLDRGIIDVSWQLQALPYLAHGRRAHPRAGELDPEPVGPRVGLTDGPAHPRRGRPGALARPAAAGGRRAPVRSALPPARDAAHRRVTAHPGGRRPLRHRVHRRTRDARRGLRPRRGRAGP
jgi:hypothetical protein